MPNKPMKELSPKQQKLAAAAAPTDKITGDDFKAMSKKPKKKKSIMYIYGETN